MLPLPQTTEYALRALLHIAARHPEPVRVVELAGVVKAPANYLSKTLHQLARAGLLQSTRGPLGGFRLTQDPTEVTLEEVIAVFTPTSGRRCLLGHGACGQNPACTVHERWAPVSARMRQFFATTTVADLVEPDGPPTSPRRRRRSAASKTPSAQRTSR